MTDLFYGTSGPHDAEIVLVGEAWGAEEELQKQPFVGSAGVELNRMLAEAKIDRKSVLVTNIVPKRPLQNEMWRFFHAKAEAPDGSLLRGLHPTPIVLEGLDCLNKQISSHPRKLVISTGNYALWALSHCTGYDTPGDAFGRRVPNGIMNWRGSMWYDEINSARTPLLPIIHPAAILRQWSLRAITVHDLKARVPMALRGDWRPNPAPVFWAPPTFEQARTRLTLWLNRAEAGTKIRLAVDKETTKGLISCIGFADSVHFAMSIPFVKKVEGDGLTSWWTNAEEVVLIRLIQRLLTHPNILVEGQNFIYDTQYAQHWWGITPRLDFDTMLAHHLLWPGTPKGLDYLSSLYCNYHWYWKEDHKEWDLHGTVEQLLEYNCLDCIRTYESAESLRTLIPQLGLARQWTETMEREGLALRMMNRGVRIDMKRRRQLGVELLETLNQIYSSLEKIIPQSWLPPPKKGTKQSMWYTSNKQQQYVFGELLGMKLPRNRKTGNPTLGKEALDDLPRKYPEFTRLFAHLKNARSVAVYKSHFVDAPIDPDERMRCSFNPAGTETFRFNSSANAMGRGTNLQNIPSGDED